MQRHCRPNHLGIYYKQVTFCVYKQVSWGGKPFSCVCKAYAFSRLRYNLPTQENGLCTREKTV